MTPEDSTWVKLYRKSLDSRAFNSPELWKVWTWCLMKAQHKPIWIPVQTGRGLSDIKLEAGQFLYGRKSASRELKMPESSVDGRMKKLEKAQNLVLTSDTHFSIVTICNWEVYQTGKNKIQQATQQATNRQPTGNQQATDTYKNDKNVKNDKNTTSGDDAFDKFWTAYPKKIGKQAAFKKWEQINPDSELLAKMLLTIEASKKSDQWKKEKGQYIPNPLTWLNQGRWDDELTVPQQNSVPRKYVVEAPKEKVATPEERAAILRQGITNIGRVN